MGGSRLDYESRLQRYVSMLPRFLGLRHQAGMNGRLQRQAITDLPRARPLGACIAPRKSVEKQVSPTRPNTIGQLSKDHRALIGNPLIYRLCRPRRGIPTSAAKPNPRPRHTATPHPSHPVSVYYERPTITQKRPSTATQKFCVS